MKQQRLSAAPMCAATTLLVFLGACASGQSNPAPAAAAATQGAAVNDVNALRKKLVGTWEGDTNGTPLLLTFTEATIEPNSMGAVPYDLDGKQLSFQIMGMDRTGTVISVDERELVMIIGDKHVNLKRRT